MHVLLHVERKFLSLSLQVSHPPWPTDPTDRSHPSPQDRHRPLLYQLPTPLQCRPSWLPQRVWTSPPQRNLRPSSSVEDRGIQSIGSRVWPARSALSVRASSWMNLHVATVHNDIFERRSKRERPDFALDLGSWSSQVDALIFLLLGHYQQNHHQQQTESLSSFPTCFATCCRGRSIRTRYSAALRPYLASGPASSPPENCGNKRVGRQPNGSMLDSRPTKSGRYNGHASL
mmetsp:Transcript_23599/g.67944  ORF Transcript_23599/g.67944 Transcript_23599/m.67944 type:complete len:231 (+) Transcript_23599:79-771(+)